MWGNTPWTDLSEAIFPFPHSKFVRRWCPCGSGPNLPTPHLHVTHSSGPCASVYDPGSNQGITGHWLPLFVAWLRFFERDSGLKRLHSFCFGVPILQRWEGRKWPVMPRMQVEVAYIPGVIDPDPWDAPSTIPGTMKDVIMYRMFVSPQNVYVNPLTPNGMVFERRAFGRWLDLDEAMRVRASWWD